MRPGWGPIWVTSGTQIDGSRASEGAQRATGYQYHQNTSRNFISGPVSAVRGIPGGIAAEIHENLARMADFAPKWQILEIPSSNIPGPHCRCVRKLYTWLKRRTKCVWKNIILRKSYSSISTHSLDQITLGM